MDSVWNEEERRFLDEARRDANKEVHRRQPGTRLLSPFTVSCLVFNRTIGSGIFVAPWIVFESTRSVGVSLIFWFVGGMLSTFGLLVWLELGLTVPKTVIRGMRFSVPRNGGEKNYLEFIYERFRRQTTSVYGIAFILIGNLTGNAIAMGSYVMVAAGRSADDHLAKLIAFAALTIACLLHGIWRAGGIYVNNLLAVLKFLLLFTLFVLGLCAANKDKFVHTQTAGTNFDIHRSFAGKSNDTASYADCLVNIMYSYSGYEQPFYVLSEVRDSRNVYAPTMLVTMLLVVLLFTAVNVAYFCAWTPGSNGPDIATTFLKNIFGTDSARRVMAALIAVSIFGNIVVFTFTAARVKQEIAKEGILPYWRWLSANRTTPFAKLKRWMWRSEVPHPDEQSEENSLPHPDEKSEENSPIPALALHWFFSCLMLAFTASLLPTRATNILVHLYSYFLILLVGLFTAGGLLYVRLWRERDTWIKESGFRPWGGPISAIIYVLSCAIFLIFAFIPVRDDGSPFASINEGYKHYIIPTVGWCSLLAGLVYLAGLETYFWSISQRLITWRREVILEGPKGHLFYGEVITVERRARNPPGESLAETPPEDAAAPQIPMTVLLT